MLGSKKKKKTTLDLEECFGRNRKRVQKDSNKAVTGRVQFWKEKRKQQSTTGINARTGLILTDDLQGRTQEYLQSTDCIPLCQLTAGH